LPPMDYTTLGIKMRFVVAAVLLVINTIIYLVISKGFTDIGVLLSYLLGAAVLAPGAVAAICCIPKSGRNNKRFFRAFNVVLIFSIIGNAGNLIKLYGQPPQAIIGANGAVEITVPSHWIGYDVPNDNVLLNIKNRSGSLNLMVGYEYTGNDKLELEHYAQLLGNRFQATAPRFESASKMESCNSTNLKCVYQVVRTSEGEKGTVSILAALSGGEGFYNFMAITTPGLLDNYEQDIFSALTSIKEI